MDNRSQEIRSKPSELDTPISAQTLSQEELLKGNHSDIANKVTPATPEDRIRLSLHLALRDIFNPYCAEFSQEVAKLSASDLTRINSSFQGAMHHHDVQKDGDFPSENDGRLSRREKQLLKGYQGMAESNIIKSPYSQFASTMQLRDISSFYWADAEIENMISHYGREENELFQIVKTPVGEYGEKFAEDNLETSRVLLHLSDSLARDYGIKLWSQFGSLLRNETVRGMYSGTQLPPLATLQEGLLSVSAAISQMTMEKLPGYDDPVKLLEAIVEQDLVSQYALMLRIGYQMPMFHDMKYVSHLLDVNAEGKPVLSRSFRDALHKSLELSGRNKVLHDHWVEVAATGHRTGAHLEHGLGCPVGRKGHDTKESGLHMLSKTYLELFKTLSAIHQTEKPDQTSTLDEQHQQVQQPESKLKIRFHPQVREELIQISEEDKAA